MRTTKGPTAVDGNLFRYSKTGIKRFEVADLYHFAVTLSWPQFFIGLLVAEALINLLFAFLYIAFPDAISGAAPGSLVDAFFFSIETLATVGYGVMAPKSTYGHVVASAEVIAGLIFTAVITGLIFVRFSRPRSKILFADSAVMTKHRGVPSLLVRIANSRTTLLPNAFAKMTMIVVERGDDDVPFRQLYDLDLVRNNLPMFATTWTIAHPINDRSPLKGKSKDELQKSDARIFLSVEARDQVLGTSVFSIKSYDSKHLLEGMRYQDASWWEEGGVAVADLSKLSSVESDTRDPIVSL